VPRDEHFICSRCTRHAIEDELHDLFQCPAYQQTKLKYGSRLFFCFGDNCNQGEGVNVGTRESS
jgi:hypothetical protein